MRHNVCLGIDHVHLMNIVVIFYAEAVYGCREFIFFFCSQVQALGNNIRDGDVLLSNHPTAGGSHLPDLTLITPVFYKYVSMLPRSFLSM